MMLGQQHCENQVVSSIHLFLGGGFLDIAVFVKERKNKENKCEKKKTNVMPVSGVLFGVKPDKQNAAKNSGE